MKTLENDVATLYRTNGRQLAAFVRRRVGADDADDIVQEAFVRLLKADVDELRYPRTYLFSIAINLIADARRKDKRMGPHFYYYSSDDRSDASLEFPLNLNPREISDSMVETIFVQDRIRALPEKCRAAFLMHRLEGLTYPEIADRLSLSLRTIKRIMARTTSLVERTAGR